MSIALNRIKKQRVLKSVAPSKITTPSDKEGLEVTQDVSEIVEDIDVREVNIKPYNKETFKRSDVQVSKSLDAETLKYWEGIFNGAEAIKEGDLIDRMLANYHLEETPTNNTICLNEVFNAEYEGYLVQAGYHIWETKKK